MSVEQHFKIIKLSLRFTKIIRQFDEKFIFHPVDFFCRDLCREKAWPEAEVGWRRKEISSCCWICRAKGLSRRRIITTTTTTKRRGNTVGTPACLHRREQQFRPSWSTYVTLTLNRLRSYFCRRTCGLSSSILFRKKRTSIGATKEKEEEEEEMPTPTRNSNLYLSVSLSLSFFLLHESMV